MGARQIGLAYCAEPYNSRASMRMPAFLIYYIRWSYRVSPEGLIFLPLPLL